MLSFTGNIEKIKQKLFLLDKNKEYDVEIKLHRNKRSNNALCTQIASILNNDKDSIYVLMLKRYGVSDLIPIRNDVPVEDYFKYYNIETKTDKYTWYKVYKGSSRYDTKEMSVLLQGIVSECKEMGILTKEDIEIQKLINDWEKEKI